MKPSLSDYQSGGGRWWHRHLGVQIEIGHHGISAYSPEGTWNYYLFLTEDLFRNPADWQNFNLEEETLEFVGGVRHHFPYDDCPDLGFHGGYTFGERMISGRQTIIKLGCDYNHLWDREAGYPATLESVKRDAEASADLFNKLFGKV